MKKNVFFLLVIVSLFFSCDKINNNKTNNTTSGSNNALEDYDYDDDYPYNDINIPKPVKLDKETRYYNDYLGFSYAVPKDWWVYHVNKDNLGESKTDITDDGSMDILLINYDDYAFWGAWLMAFGNLETTDLDAHMGFDLDARFLDGINNMSDFMKFFEDYMMSPEYGEECQLKDSRRITINRKPFELREFLVTSFDNPAYYILTLCCQVNEGYFLSIKADYWALNTRAKNAVLESVRSSIEFY